MMHTLVTSNILTLYSKLVWYQHGGQLQRPRQKNKYVSKFQCRWVSKTSIRKPDIESERAVEVHSPIDICQLRAGVTDNYKLYG